MGLTIQVRSVSMQLHRMLLGVKIRKGVVLDNSTSYTQIAPVPRTLDHESIHITSYRYATHSVVQL
ncbi:hypothetical protein PanWU01x14_022110 [Parasponia andersonii]|uniref:Uncharacterized protein n=1 Tax=Parasponia andersonii TaxID=3476 RepID=A0A2P5DY70_PARAD|nr:hypothetical protein PanWU01x14_022110 [Parasponia andersonii]